MSDDVLKPQLIIRQFDNLTSYAERFVEMKTLTEQRDADTPDELWILQHHDVLTQGQAGKPEHILMSSNIPVVQTDRGGKSLGMVLGSWLPILCLTSIGLVGTSVPWCLMLKT